MNALVNPGFESGLDGWTVDGLVLPQGPARSGTAAAQLIAVRPYIGAPLAPAGVSQSVTLKPGETYHAWCWYRLESGSAGRLTVALIDGTRWRYLLERAPGTRDWQHADLIFTAESSSGVFWAQAATEACQFSLDDCGIALMAITQQIRDALVSDLQQITTGNGYSTTLVEVGREPKRITEARAPAVYIAPGEGGTSELETISSGMGSAVQRFTLQMIVRSATPNQDMDNLLDDVRNAIERSGSAVLALSDVVTAAVTGWTETVTEPDIALDTYYREATVEVTYLYRRGSA
ncbi:MAG: hypothetical protein D6760_13540 [Deltaproteobacteria bacterium]|nr:MAG: hypothetical protein D6760_13540 [Deltaproteobacteria bacterium]